MKKQARGETGSVRGDSRKVADEILTNLLKEIAKSWGRSFKRSSARKILAEQGVDGDRAEGYLDTLDQMPGIIRGENGHRAIVMSVADIMEFRHFRMTLGQAHIGDMLTLYRVLKGPLAAGDLTPTLVRLVERIEKSMHVTIGPTWKRKLL